MADISTSSFAHAKQGLLSAIGRAPLEPSPYPHFFVQDVFPQGFYRDLLSHLPEASDLINHTKTGRVRGSMNAYKHRLGITLTENSVEQFSGEHRTFWREMYRILQAEETAVTLLKRFVPGLQRRYGAKLSEIRFATDIQLLRDSTGYALGPHTDHHSKVAVMLLYFPETAGRSELGTSVYVPKQSGFTCPGGPHHKHADFDRVYTAPYIPNSGFGFFKSDISFHGVEPLAENAARRDLIQYTIIESQ